MLYELNWTAVVYIYRCVQAAWILTYWMQTALLTEYSWCVRVQLCRSVASDLSTMSDDDRLPVTSAPDTSGLQDETNCGAQDDSCLAGMTLLSPSIVVQQARRRRRRRLRRRLHHPQSQPRHLPPWRLSRVHGHRSIAPRAAAERATYRKRAVCSGTRSRRWRWRRRQPTTSGRASAERSATAARRLMWRIFGKCSPLHRHITRRPLLSRTISTAVRLSDVKRTRFVHVRSWGRPKAPPATQNSSRKSSEVSRGGGKFSWC